MDLQETPALQRSHGIMATSANPFEVLKDVPPGPESYVIKSGTSKDWPQWSDLQSPTKRAESQMWDDGPVIPMTDLRDVLVKEWEEERKMEEDTTILIVFGLILFVFLACSFFIIFLPTLGVTP